MALLDISPNVPRLESPTRKRSHEDLVASECHDAASPKKQVLPATFENYRKTVPTESSLPHISTESIVPSALVPSSPASPLTDIGSTPAMGSPSPTFTPPSATIPPSTLVSTSDPKLLQPAAVAAPAPSLASATLDTTRASAAAPGGEQPAKRKRLTAGGKKVKADELRKQEREQARLSKLAEKTKQKEEKKARAEERERKQKEKEEENRKRAEEKEKKRREKEEEARKIQQAKEKKERSQMKLASFFKAGGSSTPSKKSEQQISAGETLQQASPAGTPQKNVPATDGPSEYSKIFKPFFVKEHVTLAHNAFEMDEAAKELKSRNLDKFLTGTKSFELPRLGAAACADYFSLPSLSRPRGRPYPSVRKIMAMMSGSDGESVSAPVDLTSDSQRTNIAVKTARELLKQVPMKYVGFNQDVRPAYFGTITATPPSGSMRQLARRPVSRDLLPLQYDYDSEAEWVDDGDGEDLDLLDDEEEDVDDDEDMADFLDDSEDTLKRPLFASGLEPESSGLCFENQKRLGPADKLYQYRLEFILDTEHHHGIDPFSSHYWEPEVKRGSDLARLDPASAAAGAARTVSSNAMKPPQAPTTAAPANAFAALTQGANAKKTTAMVPAEVLDDFKRAILKYPKLSKIGLVEILSTEFTKCTKAQIKGSVEAMAERSGTGHDKVWKLKADYTL